MVLSIETLAFLIALWDFFLLGIGDIMLGDAWNYLFGDRKCQKN